MNSKEKEFFEKAVSKRRMKLSTKIAIVGFLFFGFSVVICVILWQFRAAIATLVVSASQRIMPSTEKENLSASPSEISTKSNAPQATLPPKTATEKYRDAITRGHLNGIVGDNTYALYLDGDRNTPINNALREKGIDVGRYNVEKNHRLAMKLYELGEYRLRSAMDDYRSSVLDKNSSPMTSRQVSELLNNAILKKMAELHTTDLHEATIESVVDDVVAKNISDWPGFDDK